MKTILVSTFLFALCLGVSQCKKSTIGCYDCRTYCERAIWKDTYINYYADFCGSKAEIANWENSLVSLYGSAPSYVEQSTTDKKHLLCDKNYDDSAGYYTNLGYDCSK